MDGFIHIPATLGYIALFLLVAGESAGLPIPGETSLTTTAVLAARGQLRIEFVIPIAAAAAIVGDNIGYAIGRFAGRPFLLRDGPWADRRRRAVAKTDEFYDRHGALTVFVGRWLPLLRFTAALLAGINRMRWRRFFLWNALGGICWATSIGLLAYFLGSQAENAVQAIGLIGILALVLAVAGHFAWRRLSGSGKQTQPEPARTSAAADGGDHVEP
jgi:membrane-associated protein